MTSEYRIAFKAGRAFRRERTNFVDADSTKGAIILQNGADDGLLHLIWKNRVTNENQEDLILFPGDASFVKVPQASWGRTYVLKFSSSDQIHFFWMQDADSSRDAEFVENVNRLLRDPEAIPIWPIGAAAASAQAAESNAEAGPSTAPAASTQPAASSSAAAPSGSQLSTEQMAHLRQILGQGGLTNVSQAAGGNRPDYLLQDILTPANITPLFTAHPELVSTLFPFLPSDLPVPPSAEVLTQIVGCPQFRSAVRSFDYALASGALTGFVRSLGLPEEAGLGFDAFLNAIEEQARREGGAGGSGSSGATDRGDSMDTD